MKENNKIVLGWLKLKFFGEQIYKRQVIYLLLLFTSMIGPSLLPEKSLKSFFFISITVLFCVQLFSFYYVKSDFRQHTCRTLFWPITLANYSENRRIRDVFVVAVFMTAIDLPVWIFAAGLLFLRMHFWQSAVASVLLYLVVHVVYYFLDYISEKWLRLISIWGFGVFLAAFLLFCVFINMESLQITIMGVIIICTYLWISYYIVLASGSEKIFMYIRTPDKKSKIGLIVTWLLLFICVFSILVYCLLESGNAYSINGKVLAGNEMVQAYSVWDMVVLAVYYCVSTITTLGYGDIVPLINQSRMLAITISLTGVWMTAVFISTIISIPDPSSSKDDANEEKLTRQNRDRRLKKTHRTGNQRK